MSKLTLIIEADTVEEQAQKVCELHCRLNPGHEGNTPAAPSTTAAPAVKEGSKSGKGKGGKKETSSEEVPAQETPVAAPVEEDPFADEAPAAAAKAYTIEDIKAFGTKVTQTKGLQAAKDLLKKHGADRPAALDASKYAAFVADCEAVLK